MTQPPTYYQISPRIVAFLPPETIEPQAMDQIRNISELPIVFKHVAVMPDCHVGIGATVGTVIATRDAVIPAAVGVDIGCGMISVKTRFSEAQLRARDLRSIREGIERRIPASAGHSNSRISATAQPRIERLKAMIRPAQSYHYESTWPLQLGSLGGGNHFIELSSDESGVVWAVLHSGSRGVGNRIARHYIQLAQKLCEKRHIALVDRDLAYLVADDGTSSFDDYIHDLHWAQEFARHNRDEMMDRVLTELSFQFYGEDGHQVEIEVERINCHHNFTQIERHFGRDVWVTRKGAIQASVGMKAMIPGSMGSSSYIVSGLGHPLAFESAPHGAGRRFSRTEARRRFTIADLERQMAGIEHRSAKVLIDEIPSAYKDIDQVMECSRELVRIEHTLRQIVNVKGD
jgi:tRNA-splicing ligase RtcB